jgi:formylglycine-generating enzyme required for sulfatase activity/tetratricopeptide (TPR) repeat protein
MSTYYYGSRQPYLQYLQQKSFFTDVTDAQRKSTKTLSLAVAKGTRETIASDEALARENIRAMESGFGSVVQATQEGFERLSWDVQEVGRGVSELNATFQWGFGEMLTQMNRLNNAVSELVRIAQTPVQTEANEHFQIANDALRRHLYTEALEEVEKAIAKYRLEWRYYSLAGTIRLGNVSGGLEFLDLPKAEEHFLLAAKYAGADNPKDAARAFLAASWAAYCQGKNGPALKYAEEAMALDPRLAEAMFQAAKVLMALSDPETGLAHLAKAIALDKCYALKAAADGDFQRYQSELNNFLETLRREKLNQLRPPIESALKKYEFCLSRSKEVREDPLFQRARAFLAADNMPLWDLMSATGSLLKLPGQLDERASGVSFLTRTELPGPDYEVEETYVEEPPPGAGLFRRLAGAKELTRLVKKRGITETIDVYDATGAFSIHTQFAMVTGATFARHKEYEGGIVAGEKVCLPHPFLVALTPVTVGQYCAILRRCPATPALASNPVVNVSWYDAVNYCNALSREVGLDEAYVVSPRGVKWKGVDNPGYRLLTDAEWQWACWGSTAGALKSVFTWKSEDIDKVAWVKENSGGVIHPVATKQPNDWGLYDMLGNVLEWVFDWFLLRQYFDVLGVGTAPSIPYLNLIQSERDPVAPTGKESVDNAILATLSRGVESPIRYVAGKPLTASVLRTVRGGSYGAEDRYIRGGASAMGADPTDSTSPLFSEIGFRVARTVIAELVYPNSTSPGRTGRGTAPP